MNRATSPTGWARNPDGSPGYTWNPISGCLNHDNGLCKGGGFPCYARKLANGRLKPLYLANKNTPNPAMGIQYSDDLPPISSYDAFYPRFWEERVREEFGSCYAGAIPKGIVVCDMGDLFGIGVPEAWTRRILSHIGMSWYREHRFYLLTKQAQRLPEFSPFPDNAWVGVTATDTDMTVSGLTSLSEITAKVKYISFEPLLSRIPLLANALSDIDWLIIGACTGTTEQMLELAYRYEGVKYPIERLTRLGKTKVALQPKIEWVREIVEAADKAGVKVFLKDNLTPLLQDNFGEVRNKLFTLKDEEPEMRQEMPE